MQEAGARGRERFSARRRQTTQEDLPPVASGRAWASGGWYSTLCMSYEVEVVVVLYVEPKYFSVFCILSPRTPLLCTREGFAGIEKLFLHIQILYLDKNWMRNPFSNLLYDSTAVLVRARVTYSACAVPASVESETVRFLFHFQLRPLPLGSHPADSREAPPGKFPHGPQ